MEGVGGGGGGPIFCCFFLKTCITKTIDCKKQNNIRLISYSNHTDIFMEGRLSKFKRKTVNELKCHTRHNC